MNEKHNLKEAISRGNFIKEAVSRGNIMRRMPFERPTDYYDERITEIDKQICELIKERKVISNNNPGFPPLENVSSWAKKYELCEDMLKSVFTTLLKEEQFRPLVEPNGFRMHIPVLKSVEIDNRLYSVTYIRQYTNASLVNFNIDWDTINQPSDERLHHSHFKLFLGQQYDCQMAGGGGSEGHFSYNFIVSPPLPDNITGLDLVFKEHKHPINDTPAGLEIVMHLG